MSSGSAIGIQLRVWVCHTECFPSTLRSMKRLTLEYRLLQPADVSSI